MTNFVKNITIWLTLMNYLNDSISKFWCAAAAATDSIKYTLNKKSKLLNKLFKADLAVQTGKNKISKCVKAIVGIKNGSLSERAKAYKRAYYQKNKDRLNAIHKKKRDKKRDRII